MSNDANHDNGRPPAGGEKPSPASPPASDPAGEDAAERAFEAASPGDLEDVDPELLRLPRRRRRHPLVAAVVIGLSLYLLYFVREDFLYFLQPRTPADLGEVGQALQAGKLRSNRYVTLAGAPDRKHALVLEARFGGFESIFRLLQTENRVFVQQHRESRGSDESLTGSYTGQLLPFRSLPYHRRLEAYLARTMTLAHDLDLGALAAAKAQGGRARDQSGATIQLTPDTQFWINAAYPDEWLLQANKSEYPTALDATRRLLQGVKEPFVLEEGTATFWRFVIVADAERVRELMARFREIDQAAKRPSLPPDPMPPQPRQNLVRRQVSFQARFDQLSVERKVIRRDLPKIDGARVRSEVEGEQELVINAADPTAPARYVVEAGDGGAPRLTAVRQTPVRLPAAAVLFISTSSPLRVPPDAFVLITGKRPAQSWYYAVFYLLLLSFVVINAATLLQRLRERRRRA